MTENPYESPHTDSRQRTDDAKRRGWRMAVGLLLLLGALPAAGIAFFCCCTAGLAADRSGDAAIPAGAIGGLIALGLMLWGGVVWLRSANS